MQEQKKAKKSDVTRLRILDAAAKTFREVGYSAASLRDIASATDMQAASLYYHFESKDQLAEEIMKEGVDGSYKAVKNAVATLPEGANPLDKLEVGFEAHLTYLLNQSDYAVAMLRMLHQTPAPIRERTQKRQRAFGRFFGDLLEAAQTQNLVAPEADLSALRMFLFGAMNWTPEWYTESGLAPSELAAQLRLMIERS